jgi:hypothetical protein
MNGYKVLKQPGKVSKWPYDGEPITCKTCEAQFVLEPPEDGMEPIWKYHTSRGYQDEGEIYVNCTCPFCGTTIALTTPKGVNHTIISQNFLLRKPRESISDYDRDAYGGRSNMWDR